MDDKTWKSLQLRSSICPGLETEWPLPEHTHTVALHKTAEELRSCVHKADAAMDAVEADADLSAEGKRHKMQEIAMRALAQLAESNSLEKTRLAVQRQLDRWTKEVAEAVKPAQTEAEAVLHSDIRRHVANLKDQRERMSFLEQRGSDPVTAAALLEGPAYLSNLNDAEIALIRAKIEAKFLPPEIVQAKHQVTKSMGELERGHRTAQALIANRAGLQNEMPTIAEGKTAAPKTAVFAAAPKKAGRPKAPVWAEEVGDGC